MCMRLICCKASEQCQHILDVLHDETPSRTVFKFHQCCVGLMCLPLSADEYESDLSNASAWKTYIKDMEKKLTVASHDTKHFLTLQWLQRNLIRINMRDKNV